VVRVSARADGRVESIVVEDTGRGIRAEELPRIFDAFSQGEPARTGEAGTGLGLTISKSYCDLLGYRLRAESTVNVGTRMIVEM
jgi:signal transduction histidine kinase